MVDTLIDHKELFIGCLTSESQFLERRIVERFAREEAGDILKEKKPEKDFRVTKRLARIGATTWHGLKA